MEAAQENKSGKDSNVAKVEPFKPFDTEHALYNLGFALLGFHLALIQFPH